MIATAVGRCADAAAFRLHALPIKPLAGCLKNDSECFDRSRSLTAGFLDGQHERKNSNNINVSPFALSMVEGLLMGFSAAC
jgi:hypothetical protein